MKLFLGCILALSLALPLQAKVLEGLSNHSTSLPPLENQFRPGTTYDEAPKWQAPAVNKWQKIPNWAAGTWQSKQQSLIYQFNYRTRKQWDSNNRFSYYLAEERFGKQMDSQGGIWDLPLVPIINKALSKESVSYHNITNVEYLYAADDGIVMRVRSVVTLVSRETAQIMSAYQQESISTRLPEGETMRVRDSIRVFDIEGRPVRSSKVEAIAYRTKSFEPVDEKNGVDLKALFFDFLRAQNLNSLLPAEKADR